MTEGTFTLFRKKNGYWYYWTYDRHGKRFQKSTGKKTKSAANVVASERLRNGTLLTFRDALPSTLFSEYVKDFYIYDRCPYIQGRLQRGFRYSVRQAKNNRYYLEEYILPFFKNDIIEDVTVGKINRWLLELPEKEDLSNKTANNILTLVRQIFEKAVEDGIIDHSPAKRVKPLSKSADSKRRVAFTRDEVKTIITGWKNNMARTACILAAQTGMRSGEIRALWPEQIHRTYIEVNASYNNDDDGRKCTKSGYSRFVPITEELYQLLQEINSGGVYVFSFSGEKAVAAGYFDRLLQKRLDELNIRPAEGTLLSFHSFRHYFNSRLIAAGVQGEKIRAVIGHEDDSMTEHYAHLEPEDLAVIRDVQKNSIA